MEYMLDFSFLERVLDASNPFEAMWYLLVSGGWILLTAALIRGLWEVWLSERRIQYFKGIEYMLLAIHVPKQTEQTPKAVENIFAHLTGMTIGKGTLVERYWGGRIQDNFAVEIVSQSGFIQFYVRLPVRYRDVFEAAVFAQYPDAEITDTVDYTQDAPQTWPDEHYDLWGSEFSLTKPDVYPIRTFVTFEDKLTQTFKDPLASLLEYMASLRTGEQVWIQFPLRPTQDDWKKRSDDEVKRLIGAKVVQKLNPIQKIIQFFINFSFDALSQVTGYPDGEAAKGSAPAATHPSLMQYLSPGERAVVEQIQMKGAKPAFEAKVRVIYIAPKEIFNKPRAMTGIIGAFKQLSSLETNGFTLDRFTKVAANYFFVKRRIMWRQNKLMRNYIFRASGRGRNPYILNVEELATLWHFPMIDAKVPLVSRASSKKAEPPSTLPIRESEKVFSDQRKKEERAVESELPDNIPFI